MTLEKVKVYRSLHGNFIYIHRITTPVFYKHNPRNDGRYPRLEEIGDCVHGYTGADSSRSVEGTYPWIPKGKVVECYYDESSRRLL